jgi:Arc/MetJ-type ribon-helix-helix transcriptional regulator
MTIELKPEHARVVSEAMESGAYEHPDDVIARALELLRGDEGWLQDHKEEIAAKIERGFAQFSRGEFLSPDESRADMQTRKTEWMKNRRA